MNKLPMAPDDESMCRLIAGRIGATVAILSFLGCYIYGITQYGFLAGIALGWLPAAVVAWFAAHAAASSSTSLLRRAIPGSRHFSSLVHASRLHR